MSEDSEADYENDSHDEFEENYDPSYDEYLYEEFEDLER
jgi:hypothetical protein